MEDRYTSDLAPDTFRVPDRKSSKQLSADDVIQALGLTPLSEEGGMVAETYSSKELYENRRCGSAIYYLLTGDAFSHLHMLSADEIWHFYYGDPVELIQIRDRDGEKTVSVLGNDLTGKERPQILVPKNTWQGARLLPGGRHGFALMGTTMSPSYLEGDFRRADREELLRRFPEHRNEIEKVTGDIIYR